MGLQANLGWRIQFRFERASNICRKNGGTPNAAVYAQYTTKAGKKIKSLATAPRKAKGPEWCENSEIIEGVSNETAFTFVVLDAHGPAPLTRSVKLAQTKPYTVGDLLQMRTNAEQLEKASGVTDGAAAACFAVPLVPISGEATERAEASLVLCLRDWMSDKERREFYQQVEVDWKSKHRDDLDRERAGLTKELALLSADVPSTTNVKAMVDMAAGLFASISSLLDNKDVLERSPHLVISLITSYRAMLHQIRFVTTAQSVELSIQYYGKACLELAQSIRILERCLRKPEILKDNSVVAEINHKTRRFEAYPQDTSSPLGSPNCIFAQRESHRNKLVVNSPLLLTALDPTFSVEPSHLPPLRQPLSTPTVQYLTSWALLSSRAELKRLLWLHGPANCGKTQLATSLIDVFGRMGVSTAYFSFNNHSAPHEDDDIHGDPPSLECMTKTIAFQFAAYVEGLQSTVMNAIQGAGKSFETLDFAGLFERLVVSPLLVHSQSSKSGVTVSSDDKRPAHAILTAPEPVVIILDDADQCSPRQLDELLEVVVGGLARLPKEARVIMCSRELGAVRDVLERCAMASIVGFGEDAMAMGNSASSNGGANANGTSGKRRQSVVSIALPPPTPRTPGTARTPMRWSGEVMPDPKGKRRLDESCSSRAQ